MEKEKVVLATKVFDKWCFGRVGCREPRYIIMRGDEILDDAQGYGYKSAQNAYRAWSYKSKPKKVQRHIKNTRRKIRDWVDENEEFFAGIEDDIFHVEKEGYRVTKKDFAELMESAPDILLESMPCTMDELWKYWTR